MIEAKEIDPFPGEWHEFKYDPKTAGDIDYEFTTCGHRHLIKVQCGRVRHYVDGVLKIELGANKKDLPK